MRKLWPWEDPEDIVLSNGITVKTISVPPYALADVWEALPPPPAPMEELRSKRTGTTEVVKALPETPEWDQYWQVRRKHDRMINSMTGAFRMDYGTVAWRYPDTNEWVDIPPEDWEPPAMMEEWGVSTPLTRMRRVAFIKYIIVRDGDDMKLLEAKWESNRPPDKKEVKAAEGPFELNGQTEPQ